ncbi:MAG: ABC-type transport auxiliary lipoprotein family protein [Pseudazoarcus pumilus]|nr:ABC-type transport auxiliary lipoprotein family protein [Pseudazoarcus pumilus]
MKKHVLLGALGAALLSACSILPESQPVDIYRLPTTLVAPDTSAPRPGGIGAVRVLRPATGNTLSGRRIVVVPDDLRVSVYADAAWADTVPALLRERLADALRAGNRFDTVSTDEHSLRAEFEIDTDLRGFHSEYRGGTPDAVVRIDAHLVHAGSRRVVASRSFESRVRAGDAALPTVVAALGKAADEAATRLAAWAADTAAAAPRPRN